MALDTIQTFFRRPSDLNAHVEDRVFVSNEAAIFGVADAVSAAYSPLNPPKMANGFTSGQAVVNCLQDFYDPLGKDLEKSLLAANEVILYIQRTGFKKDPINGDDVGGCSFMFCQILPDRVKFVYGGDCFALVVGQDNSHEVLCGFDEAAYQKELEDIKSFAKHLEVAQGNKGKAWDLYWSEYTQKRLFCANKNIGKGGYATLNGDQAVEQCWQTREILLKDLNLVLLGTDGMLPFSMTHPAERKHLGEVLLTMPCDGNWLANICEWRDDIEKEDNDSAHLVGHPEASAILLTFSPE